MPELPEVETTRRGITPHLSGQRIERIEVRQPRLRWPVPQQVQSLVGAHIEAIQRRGKYLLMSTRRGTLIWHLGMSGSMRILPSSQLQTDKHEHIQLDLENGQSLRFRDPRRFGALLFTEDNPLHHPLLASLGPEPLTDAFNASYLQQQCARRNSAIKAVIMDSHVVVGVGNIYACESLFLSRINPRTRASRISLPRLEKLVASIQEILGQAIVQGGTTLQDFTQSDGKPGYFAQSLKVYGNHGNCPVCQQAVKRITQAQRSTFYCSHCQH